MWLADGWAQQSGDNEGVVSRPGLRIIAQPGNTNTQTVEVAPTGGMASIWARGQNLLNGLRGVPSEPAATTAVQFYPNMELE